MKVALIGANGQLGADMALAFTAGGDEVISLTHSDVEVADADSVRGALSELGADLIVNTAAVHHLPACEEDPARAFAVNAIGARNLALVSGETDTPLMHVSTDYVFDGAKGRPYRESDAPAPLNVYGASKLAGEHLVAATTARHFILRVSGLYGKNPCRAKGLNFVELMLKLARERGEVHVVEDERLTPTSTAEVARQAVVLSRTDAYGLYHATAEGACTWHEFAGEIFNVSGVPVKLHVAEPGRFPVTVARPKYSVLENARLKAEGLNTFGPWQEALRSYLEVEVACP